MVKSAFKHLPVTLLLIFAITGCENSKHLAYMQDLADTSKSVVVPQYPYRPITLQVDDELQVLVTSSDPETSSFFNISASTISSSNATVNSYRVTPTGIITLPIIGDQYVLGMTTQQVKEMVLEKLKPFLKDAVVTVKLVNFRVTVIGEVSKPIVVPVDRERFNVLEAVGAAGDMTVFAKRYNVRVLRRSKEGMEIGHLDFNNSKFMYSPYFQLQQNDVVYVEPQKSKGIASERATILLPIMVSITTLTLTIVNLISR